MGMLSLVVQNPHPGGPPGPTVSPCRPHARTKYRKPPHCGISATPPTPPPPQHPTPAPCPEAAVHSIKLGPRKAGWGERRNVPPPSPNAPPAAPSQGCRARGRGTTGCLGRFSHANKLGGKPGPERGSQGSLGAGGNMRTTSPANSVSSVLGGHIWVAGQGSDPPKPFPVPLPHSHAKIQEGNDAAKQGQGTAGAHWPGWAAVAPLDPPPAPG